MPRTRTSLTAVLAVVAVVTLTSCGGDSPSTDPTDTPTPESSDTGTAAPEESDGTGTPAPTDEGEPPAVDVTVTVNDLVGANEYTDAMFEQYRLFETALWASLGAGEISVELRALSGPDVLTGMEETIAGARPAGGAVTVSPTLDDLTIADIGFGTTLTEAFLTGCSDQTQLQFPGGESGTSGSIAATVTLDTGAGGYIVTSYVLGAEAC